MARWRGRSWSGSCDALTMAPPWSRYRSKQVRKGYPIANDGEYGGQGELGREVYVDNDSGDLRSMLGAHHCKGCRSCKYFHFVLDGSERPPRLDPPIWLHSWKYKFPSLGLDFESPLPAWAQSSAQVESSGG
mmetsp:Transcript_68740/g.223821  ORF Transcript_68740/g.223821 Transcript_68740/m.223821 type:complete len:132 (-) Transcript_68740:7-402(-)